MASHVQQPAAAAAEAPGASSSGRSLVAHPNVPLRYSVAEASSYSGNYHPSNILVDRPHDLTSRWSGASVVSMQSVHTNVSGPGPGPAASSSAPGSGAATSSHEWRAVAPSVAATVAAAAGAAREREGVSSSSTSHSASSSTAQALAPASSHAAALHSTSPLILSSAAARRRRDAATGTNTTPASPIAATPPGALAVERMIAADQMISAARDRERQRQRQRDGPTEGASAPSSSTTGAGVGANASANQMQSMLYDHLHSGAGLYTSGRTLPPASPAAGASSSPSAPSSGASAATAAAAAAGSTKQYILLQLDRPAVVRRIQFGKYHKAHPCNLADFKVYGWPITSTSSSTLGGCGGGGGIGSGGAGSAEGSAAAVAGPTPSFNDDSELDSPLGTGSVGGGGGGRWIRLLRAGLRNDNVKEEFDLRWTDEAGIPFACRYIKLVPLAAHQPKFNFSVWYIALSGVRDAPLVASVARAYGLHAEDCTTRLILKHLRERAHWHAFKALLASSGIGNGVCGDAVLAPDGAIEVQQHQQQQQQSRSASAKQLGQHQRPFEHPLLTHLFDSLVKRGAWDEAESWLESAAFGLDAPALASSVTGLHAPTQQPQPPPLFSAYLSRTLPRPRWQPIEPAEPRSADADDAPSPCGRGGHQMCLDSDNGIAYMFGGWDGERDLADFWAYHIHQGTWRLISADAQAQGGPGPRSCHKMCYCPRTGFIYVLGRFVDQDRQLELAAVSTVAAATGHSRNGSAAAAEGSAGSAAAAASSTAGRAAQLLDALLSSRDDIASGTASPSGSATPGGPSSSSSAHRAAHTPPLPAASEGHPSSSLWEADFYRFSTRTGQWTLLSRDTANEGGPRLLYDHQMLVDHESQLLYVFGGRVIHPADPNRIELSGMYRYDVIASKWAFLFDDSTPAPWRIPSRVGHSMLIDTRPSGQRQLWIMSGQRGDRYLTDMWRYDLATGKCSEVTRDYLADGPHAGFTPRAALDSKSHEIYYFTGLVQRRSSNERLRSSFWIYHMDSNTWSLLYEYGGVNSEANKNRTNETHASLALGAEMRGYRQLDVMDTDDDAPMDGGVGGPGFMSNDDALATQLGFDSSSVDEDMSSFFVRRKEPQPRYAAQMVFDAPHSTFYMFGGNPADPQAPSIRLDDFWQLTLVRPSVEDVLRQAKFLVRQQRFYEMTKGGKGAGFASPTAMQALTYLQTEVSAVVNHSDEGESTIFRKLMSHLLTSGGGGGGASGDGSLDDVHFVAPEDTLRGRRQRHKSNVPSATSSDAIGSMEDSDMLSISQIMEQKEAQACPSTAAAANDSIVPGSAHVEEGRPTELYRQRLRLFNKLLKFFPPDCCEPTGDLCNAVALLSARFAGKA